MSFPSARELTWLTSFVFLGLITLTPLRSPPVLPLPAHSRIVTDAEGVKVAVPLPFRTIAGSNYLQVTHAPEALFKSGGPRDRIQFAAMMMGRFYPDVLKNDALWDSPHDVESLLAHEDGVTFFSGSRPALWQRLGIPVLTTALDSKNPDDYVFSAVRIANAAVGHEKDGKAIIADYQQAYTDLKEELKPETLTNLPRVLSMGSSTKDWSSVWASSAETPAYDDQIIGVTNATAGFQDTGRQQDAERILAMNPDIIFVGGESVDDFNHDPRWRGLKAVLNKRIYGGGSGFRPGIPTCHLDERPLAARLEAEIVHPDRLQPKIRLLARGHFLKAYGYRLSDDEIDKMLGVDEQKNVPGYERFFKDYHVSIGSMDVGRGLPQ